MIEAYLVHHIWISALAWAVIYTSDYYLTIWAATLYKKQSFIEFEGSYELTPMYQDDVNKLRRFSPRFLIILVVYSVVLAYAGHALSDTPYVFGAVVGSLLFMELAIHARHIANIAYFRYLVDASKQETNPGVTGHIRLSKRVTYKQSAMMLLGMALYTLVAYALTGSSFLLGGTIGCAALALSHWRLARKSK